MCDMGWSRRIAKEEESNKRACIDTSIRNGHTIEEADLCDDGSVGCKDCPWRKK